jgi:hypothetical protein
VVWTGLVWLRIRKIGELSGIHKMLGNYRVAAQLVASRVALSSKELVSYIVLISDLPIYPFLCRGLKL